MFLLAYAIFRVLQTEPLIEGELDPHVTGCHESPDQLSAPGIGVWEVWALDHSLSRHCCDLLLMGILHSWNRRQTVLWFVIYIPSLFDWCRLNPLAFGGGEPIHIVMLRHKHVKHLAKSYYAVWNTDEGGVLDWRSPNVLFILRQIRYQLQHATNTSVWH